MSHFAVEFGFFTISYVIFYLFNSVAYMVYHQLAAEAAGVGTTDSDFSEGNQNTFGESKGAKSNNKNFDIKAVSKSFLHFINERSHIFVAFIIVYLY